MASDTRSAYGKGSGASFDETDPPPVSSRDEYGENPNRASAEEALESARTSSFQMRAVRWLWPNRFAIGKLGIAAGLPDEGKGQILCYIAARMG